MVGDGNKKWAVVLIVVVLVVAGLSGCLMGSADSEYRTHLKNAEKLIDDGIEIGTKGKIELDKGNYDEAVRLLNEKIEYDQSAIAEFQMAINSTSDQKKKRAAELMKSGAEMMKLADRHLVEVVQSVEMGDKDSADIHLTLFKEYMKKASELTNEAMDVFEKTTVNSGFKGVVLERLQNGSYGDLISGSTITFVSEDEVIKKEVQSVNGQYKIDLPPGRYRVVAYHENYELYTTGNGFFVNTGDGYQTGNIFLTVKGGISCPPNGHYTTNAKINPSQTNDPPTVNIKVIPSIIRPGQEFKIIVEGSDDTGLSSIWWWAEKSDDKSLAKAHTTDCDGQIKCDYNWTISNATYGKMIFAANARDVSYPTAGEAHQASEGEGIACAVLEVK